MEVETLFHQHPVLEPPNLLTVQTLDHVVYLYDIVDTDLERQMAEMVALQAHGVTRVVNSIGLGGGRPLYVSDESTQTSFLEPSTSISRMRVTKLSRQKIRLYGM